LRKLASSSDLGRQQLGLPELGEEDHEDQREVVQRQQEQPHRKQDEMEIERMRQDASRILRGNSFTEDGFEDLRELDALAKAGDRPSRP
jgi:hypothetical protein